MTAASVRPGVWIAAAACLALLLAACEPGSPTASEPAPSVSLPFSVAPTPTTEPTPTPAPTPSPTPDQASVPIFAAGTFITTTTNVRLRDLPGTQWGVAGNLPRGALAQVVLGPIRTGGFGWYLVRDADAAAPTYIEGWLAAGFEPDAFLAANPAATPAAAAPSFVAGYAGLADGDFGPFAVEGSTALRWALALPNDSQPGSTCVFQGSLQAASGDAVFFLKTTVAQAPAPGTVQPSFFTTHPTLRGDVFLHVASNCSWAVTVVRLPL